LKAETSEDEGDVAVKKTKLNNGNVKKVVLSAPSNLEGKRMRRKNTLFKNYRLDSDEDSDYDVRGNLKNRGKGKKRRAIVQVPINKLEFLLSWKKDLKIGVLPENEESYKIIKTKNVLGTDYKQFAQDLQAIFINIKWKTKLDHSGVTPREFEKIDLNRRILKNGIIFIWSEKEHLWDIIKIMEEKAFFYIENLAVIQLDMSKLGLEDDLKRKNKVQKKIVEKSKITNFFKSKNYVSTSASSEDKTESQESGEEANIFDKLVQFPNVEANEIFYEGEYDYLKKSKKVLLMFRRNEAKEASLELRHQRTCDVAFDQADKEAEVASSAKEYVYKMIETLLPKANYSALQNNHLKMMELWADPNKPREGWISVCEEN
jgi:hypothetical protein